jgi:hypothetical protein
MIRRNYFICTEIRKFSTQKVVQNFDMFYWDSFFPQPMKALVYKRKAVAEQEDCHFSEVFVKVFNRC